ncbi:hypothetical protein [Spartinivicinus poritis]
MKRLGLSYKKNTTTPKSEQSKAVGPSLLP